MSFRVSGLQGIKATLTQGLKDNLSKPIATKTIERKGHYDMESKCHKKTRRKVKPSGRKARKNNSSGKTSTEKARKARKAGATTEKQ